jgi:hypothetical protein
VIPVADDIDWDRFNTPEHQEAQRRCTHLVRCAVDGPTRKATSDLFAYARTVNDGNGILVRIAQLTGPCCLPQAEPPNQPANQPGTEPIQPELHVKDNKPCPPTGESPST